MPELPEVETTRCGLIPVMEGQRIASVRVMRRDLRIPVPRTLASRMAGQTVTTLRRRAKFLLIDLASGDRVMVHLGMSGSLRTEHPQSYAPRRHDHLIIEMHHGTLIVFHDPRRFGFVDLIARGVDEKSNRWLKHLGVEPLCTTFTAQYLRDTLARRSAPLKPTLMDQRVVVGVGNIYASESLFLARLHPAMRACDAAPSSVALVDAIQHTLARAIASGGSTLRDYVGARGESGYFQHEFLVYDRAGKACTRCCHAIAAITQSQRATYYCPQCQRLRRTRQKP